MPLDTADVLANGDKVDGVAGLREALLKRPDVFVQTLTEKLLIYALGRGLSAEDMPAGATDRAHGDSRPVPVLGHRARHRQQRAVSDAESLGCAGVHPGAAPIPRCRWRPVPQTVSDTRRFGDVHHQDVVAAADVPARGGRHARAAAARCDGAGASALAQTAAARPSRAGFIYMPHGADMASWTPASAGGGFELSPTLQPLEPFKDSLVVISNLKRAGGAGRNARRGGLRLAERRHSQAHRGRGLPHRHHHRPGAGASRSARRRRSRRSSSPPRTSPATSAAARRGYSCAYMNTISWASPTTPLPMEINPRTAFERLFGDGGSGRSSAAQQLREDRSILDAIVGEARALQARLGARDRARVADYLDNVREIERRIQQAETQQQQRRGADRQAARHPRVVRGAHGADVRPAGDGLPDRPDPRVHVHDVARGQPADVPGDRRLRSVARRVAPRRPGRRRSRATPR